MFVVPLAASHAAEATELGVVHPAFAFPFHLAGFAKFEGNSVLVIGQEKGKDLETRLKRNFGMMRPEGYRKCIRLMKLANKFNIPVISFIDTPGAYPGIGAEQRGQAEAIASSIDCCMSLRVPIISIITIVPSIS